MDAKDVSKEKQKQTISKSRSEEAVPSLSKCTTGKPEKDVRFAATPVEIVLEKPSEKGRDHKSKSGDISRDSTLDKHDPKNVPGSPKVSRKYFTNWRQACDKTKDRTRELLKRWRTLPETDIHDEFGVKDHSEEDKMSKGQGWSVHVWTTWVNRYSLDGCNGSDNFGIDEEEPATLTPVQMDKMTLFFTELLDLDRDDLISEQDFQHFCDKLAHFADWANNSPEYHILLEVKEEFVESFINPLPSQYGEKLYWKKMASKLPPGFTDIDNWLARWPLYLPSCSRFHRLPLFLQYFCKILFGIINKSGSGQISRQELKAFYMSVIGVDAVRCEEIINTAFNLLTSNEYLNLDYETYKRCFSNWLCGKNPNGPGQWILVPPKGPLSIEPYPVDYSALNSDPGRLEKYTPNNKTSRHSVIV